LRGVSNLDDDWVGFIIFASLETYYFDNEAKKRAATNCS